MRILALFVCCLLLFGCLGESYTDIKDLNENPDNYVGEDVVLKGNVTKSVRIGKLSGFTLKSEEGSFPVSSELLPANGKEVVVKGMVMKDALFGYYVLADSVEMT